MATDVRVARLGVLGAVAILLFGLLGTRLWFLQTVEADRLQQDLQVERTKTVPLIPERGRIFDADGRILADNERMLTVAVDWAAMRDDQDRRELFRRLSGWIDVPVREMERRFEADVYSPFLPMPVKEDIESEEIAVGLRERSEDFPGVHIIEDWKRTYPYAPLASHVLGYMGRLDPENLETYLDEGYQRNEIVGKAGVELSMEKVLHGQWGEVVYEVNAAGQVLREISRKPAVNGNDIQLSVDLDVQQYAESILKTQLDRIRNFEYENWAPNPVIDDPRDGSKHRMDVNQGERVPFKAPAGSVVVMNQENGQVAAMASYPTFDNRWFNSGVSGDKFEELYPPESAYESVVDYNDNATLTNRAVQGQYNLGSTFKPFTAYAALDGGLLGPNDYYNDTGTYIIDSIEPEVCAAGVDCELRNAWCDHLNGPCVYGSVNVYKALAVSSDTFFYKLGEDSYLRDRELLKKKTGEFSFGRDTGIDLPYEFDGRIPDDEVKADLVEAGVLREGEEPRLLVGDNIQAAIGQGLLAATPVQLATGYAAIGNGGKVLVPHVVRAIFKPGVPDGQPGYADLTNAKVVEHFLQPEVSHQIKFAPDDYQAIVDGLRRNITGPRFDEGSTTAQELFESGLYPEQAIPIAGKTGTAQGFGNYPWNDSSAFAAFSVDPERPYTVASYLEKAGYGSRGSAPLVKCMYLALSGITLTEPVMLSDPLDVDSTEVAEPADPVDTACMRATNFYPEGNVNIAVTPTD
jgi:penicillin-binding protein 2